MARYGTLLVMFAVTAMADEAVADGTRSAIDPESTRFLSLEAAPYHSTRWCIRSFITNSRNQDEAALQLSEIREPASPVHSPFAADHNTFVGRIKALRSLRLMTLWQGRDSALVIGLNRSGYVGISLDQAVARSH